MLVRMEVLRAIGPAAATRDVPSRSALLAVRYREAVWAWYAADRAGSTTARAARLEERVRRLEEAAASVELPARWYFLESARLIRVGDLGGATTAFDAGIAAPVGDAAIAPTRAFPVTVDIGALPPAMDIALLPAKVEPPPRRGFLRGIAARWLPRRRS
jgi:hypothetical protein